ncbi:MAG: acyl-CoA dehydrogenase [Alphaproteobacteria bacterium]|nr:acyl-CoA dehydrogenase [Alphaproteobacteria bacterium]
MSATAFTADLRDIKFVLFEQLDIDQQLAKFDKFKDFDKDTYEAMMEEAYKLASEVVAPLNAVGDHVGCTLDGEGNVTTPPGYKQAWDTLAEGGWMTLGAPAEFGGMGLPHVIDAMINELFAGASMAFTMYPGLTKAAANLLTEHCPAWARDIVIPRMYSGEWGGTMCLTEAGAGTSVGDNRAKATPAGEDGLYLLEGEKVFISSGDHDLAENIIHLVLARTPGAPAGTKGISIFLVPKFLFDADGNLGERNGAKVEKIEEKMGIHGSATCVISLGADRPCKGWLIGNENEGMKIMFLMMNEARIGVGIQGLATAAAAFQNAKAYAADRVQGTAVADFANPEAKPVTINQHPNVRRMLMTQKVLVETMRSLVYTVGLAHDVAQATEDPATRASLLKKVELLTPIVKAHCSEMGYLSCTLAVQTYGGYGYIKEYPVEQLLRDNKITSIYEGTNGIQAMDLLGRKMRMEGGGVFMAWLQDCGAEIERCKAIPSLADAAAALEKAHGHLGATAMHLGGLGMQGKLETAMLYASPFLEMYGTVVLGRHSLEQARIAQAALDAGATGDDARFYRGKILNATFYASNLLPKAISLGKTIQTSDESCLDEILFA